MADFLADEELRNAVGDTVLDSLDAIYKQGDADPDSPEAQLFNITQDGLE